MSRCPETRTISRRWATQVITRLQPPMNLQKWRNPQKKMVEELRKICREEARGGKREARRNSFPLKGRASAATGYNREKGKDAGAERRRKRENCAKLTLGGILRWCEA